MCPSRVAADPGEEPRGRAERTGVLGCDAPQGTPEMGVGRGEAESAESDLTPRDLALNQKDSRGREVWKTAIFALGEKRK